MMKERTLKRNLTIALAIVALGWLLILLLWGAAPFAASFDDAYYYFTIGRNWAHGHASTFDGLNKTNGYHPLWQAISVIPYLVGLDGFAAVRALLVVQLALWTGALYVVIQIVHDAIQGWTRLENASRDRRWCDRLIVAVFVALCANPFLFKMTVNGLESGVVVPVGALILRAALRVKGHVTLGMTRPQRFSLGALLALAFLARTDAIILIAIVGVWCLTDRGDAPLRAAQRITRTAEVLIIPTAVIVCYLVINQVLFGTALQISGVVKRLPLTAPRVLLVGLWIVIGLGVIAAVRKPIKKSSRLLRTRRFLSATGFYAVFCVGLVGYYATLQEVPYLWYFAPLALYGTVLAMLVAADLAEGGFVEAAQHQGRNQRLAARAPGLILALPLLVALFWAIPSYLDPGARSLLVHDARAGRWMNHHLPADARVASWDAGAIGYFAHRHVVNLDGVVNSIAYFRAGRDGTLPKFLSGLDIGWVANHGGDSGGRDPDIDRQIRGYFGKRNATRIVVVYRDTYRYTGSLDGSRTNTSTKQMGTYIYRLDRSS